MLFQLSFRISAETFCDFSRRASSFFFPDASIYSTFDHAHFLQEVCLYAPVANIYVHFLQAFETLFRNHRTFWSKPISSQRASSPSDTMSTPRTLSIFLFLLHFIFILRIFLAYFYFFLFLYETTGLLQIRVKALFPSFPLFQVSRYKETRNDSKEYEWPSLLLIPQWNALARYAMTISLVRGAQHTVRQQFPIGPQPDSSRKNSNVSRVQRKILLQHINILHDV